MVDVVYTGKYVIILVNFAEGGGIFMIFQELGKLKRQSIMTSIVLIAIGILMIICPENYITIMIRVLGFVMLVYALLGLLEYYGSNKTVIRYIYLTVWMIIGIVGIAILLFEIDALYSISWLFGAYLILSGLSNLSGAMTYARRSGRKGWWILVILALALIMCGIIIFVNPWWETAGKLFKVVGLMMLFSSLVGILRLIWIWPIRKK